MVSIPQKKIGYGYLKNSGERSRAILALLFLYLLVFCQPTITFIKLFLFFQDQRVISDETEQLSKMKDDFEILFRSKSEGNEMLKIQVQELDNQEEKMKKSFEEKEIEMRDRWKNDVDGIAQENREIEEAWNDLKEQEKEYMELLVSDNLSDKENAEIELEKEQLEKAKQLLKVEEERVAAREQKNLDAIELEMDKWEQYKKQEENDIKTQKIDLARSFGSSDLNQLISKIEGKEASIEEMLQEVVKQNSGLTELEKSVVNKTASIQSDIDDLRKEKDKLSGEQCKAVIKLEKDIIDINEEINKLDNKLSEDLKEIDEERKK